MPPMLMTALFSMLLNLLAPHAGLHLGGGAGLPHLAQVERTAVLVVDRGTR